jgi:hypothetical protein
LTEPIRQLFLAIAGFLAAIALLESGGLAGWANHLEIGPLRTVAVPVTGAIEKALAPLGAATIREDALKDLARVGWSDDAALLAEVAETPRTRDLPRAAGCTTSASPNAPNPVATPGSAPAAATGQATAPPGLRGIIPNAAGAIPNAAGAFPNAAGARTPLAADVPRTTALTPLPPVEAGKQRVVVLAGDSMMAVGLSATLMWQAAGDKNLRIVKAFHSGTGLARPEVFNWMDEYPAMLGKEKPDVVIVAIGANDGQGFVVDGKVLPYGSEDWQKVYQERLASFLAMVGSGGARVVWVALPPMRMAAYDKKIADINRIAYTVVSQNPEAAWWNPVSFVGDESGGFREFVTLGNGRTMRIRSSDGIHLSDEGAGLLTTVLIKWLDPPQPSTGAGTPAAPAPGAHAQPRRGARRPAKG